MLEHKDATMRDCRKYKEVFGRHFTKSLCEYATSKMVNRNKTKHHYTLEDVKHIWEENHLPDIAKANWYDVVFVMNMGYADYYGDLFTEHREVAIYAYLYLSDVDGYEGIAFSRWLADCKRKNHSIPWHEFVEDEEDDNEDDY